MNRQLEYRQLMEQIRLAHQAFARAWNEACKGALTIIAPNDGRRSWEQVWQASGIAYKAARPLEERRNRLLAELFQNHLEPLHQEFGAGQPEAVHAIIDFLEIDVPAFQCGYAKEEFLRKLKTIPLTDEHQERLRQYGLRLCSMNPHRREIAEAGRLIIRVANRHFEDQLRVLSVSENHRIKKKATKMLNVIENGRKDLR